MRVILSRKPFQIAIFLFLEVLSVGMGMGVPFFTILYGYFVGLFIPRTTLSDSDLTPHYLALLLRAALIPSIITFVIMALIWLPALKWLFDSSLDISNFGIPMILYSPRASFIGWIILMVLISPFLQFLMTIFGSISWIVFFDDRWKRKTAPYGEMLEN